MAPGATQESAAGLNALLSSVAAQGAPGPGLGTTVPGGPGSEQPAALALNGPTPQSSPFGGLDLAQALSRFGRPRAAREAGPI